MEFGLTEEQALLAETAGQYLAEKGDSGRVRALMETEAGFDPDQWREFASMGWLGMAIPEEFGGAGYGFSEQSVLLEALGASLLPVPFFSSVVLGASTLLELGSERFNKEHLPQVANGDLRPTLALAETAGSWNPGSVQTEAINDGGTITLHGKKSFVLDGHTAEMFLVAAKDSQGAVGVYNVVAGAPGTSVEPLSVMDLTRPLATIVLDGALGERIGEADAGDESAGLSRIMQMAVIAMANEQVGGAQRVLDMAVEYAKTRVQFGRPIGSFQAIKHKCADLLVEVESARSVAAYAARAVTEEPDELDILAPLVKSYCSEAYFHAASDNIQIHGGIGFTWEHDAHLYFKRAKSSELIFGTPAEHRAKLADRLGI